MSGGLFVTGSSVFPDITMCDACGEKIRFLGKKVCQKCYHHFCNRCVVSSSSPTSPKPHQSCKVCHLQQLDLIQRSDLEELSLLDLKYYTKRKNLSVPINVSKEHITNVIVAQQAKDLAERARRALSQVSEVADGASIETIDPALLEPYTSSYSMSGRNNARFVATEDTIKVASAPQTGSGDNLCGNVGVASTSHSETRTEKITQDIDYSLVTSLDALTEASEVSKLNVKQLKLILQKNCINFKGCVEKHELLEKVVILWHSKEEDKLRQATIAQKGDIDVESEYLCKLCMDAPVDCVLLECGHMLTCVKCGRQLAECPICRQYVTRVVHAFRV